jgi:hypothetical protein
VPNSHALPDTVGGVGAEPWVGTLSHQKGKRIVMLICLVSLDAQGTELASNPSCRPLTLHYKGEHTA